MQPLWSITSIVDADFDFDDIDKLIEALRLGGTTSGAGLGSLQRECSDHAILQSQTYVKQRSAEPIE